MFVASIRMPTIFNRTSVSFCILHCNIKSSQLSISWGLEHEQLPTGASTKLPLNKLLPFDNQLKLDRTIIAQSMTCNVVMYFGR